MESRRATYVLHESCSHEVAGPSESQHWCQGRLVRMSMENADLKSSVPPTPIAFRHEDVPNDGNLRRLCSVSDYSSRFVRAPAWILSWDTLEPVKMFSGCFLWQELTNRPLVEADDAEEDGQEAWPSDFQIHASLQKGTSLLCHKSVMRYMRLISLDPRQWTEISRKLQCLMAEGAEGTPWDWSRIWRCSTIEQHGTFGWILTAPKRPVIRCIYYIYIYLFIYIYVCLLYYIFIYTYMCVYIMMKALLLFEIEGLKHLCEKFSTPTKIHEAKDCKSLTWDIALRPWSSKSRCMSASIGFLRRVSNLEMWLKLEDLTFEWVVFFQSLTRIKNWTTFFMSKKLHQRRSENTIVFFAIDMSTEERSWKDCPKGGAVTQALEMPRLTVSAMLKGNDFYLKGCCETKSTSTFFVIAVKEVSKIDGNGFWKITLIVGLTSKIRQTGLVSRWSERVSWEAARIASANISDVASPCPSQELIQNVGFTTKKRQWWAVFHVFVLFLDMLEPLVISYFDQATE